MSSSCVFSVMSDPVTIEGPFLEMGYVCEKILRDLPDWFGMEEANKDYAEKAQSLPTFIG